jgi:hypothetical protein
MFAPVAGDQHGKGFDGFDFLGGRHGDRLDSGYPNVGDGRGGPAAARYPW